MISHSFQKHVNSWILPDFLASSSQPHTYMFCSRQAEWYVPTCRHVVSSAHQFTYMTVTWLLNFDSHVISSSRMPSLIPQSDIYDSLPSIAPGLEHDHGLKQTRQEPARQLSRVPVFKKIYTSLGTLQREYSVYQYHSCSEGLLQQGSRNQRWEDPRIRLNNNKGFLNCLSKRVSLVSFHVFVLLVRYAS